MPFSSFLAKGSLQPFLHFLGACYRGPHTNSLWTYPRSGVELRVGGSGAGLVNLTGSVSQGIFRGVLTGLPPSAVPAEVSEHLERDGSADSDCAVIEAFPDGVLQVDPRGRIRAANGAARKIFDLSLDGFLHRPVTLLFWGPSDVLLEGRRECLGCRSDGSTFPAELTTTSLGKASLLVVRDLTDKQRRARQLSESAEGERRLLSYHLRDDLGQQLTAMAYMLEALELRLNESAIPNHHELLGRLGELTREALGKTKKMAKGLYSMALDRNGLVHALDELASLTQEAHHLGCSFQCSSTLVTPEAAGLYLYRVAQEAVANAVKQGAREIKIGLAVDPEANLVLSVTDDGQTSRAVGVGLASMRHYCELMGACLSLDPGPTGGTCVRCSLPLGRT
jgi:signal transduction histidine kinase